MTIPDNPTFTQQAAQLTWLDYMQQFAFSVAVGFGYLLSFYFLIMAILKVIFPDNIGLYLSPAGWPFLGYVDADEFTELLGFWLIPAGLFSALLLQCLLAILLRRWVRNIQR